MTLQKNERRLTKSPNRKTESILRKSKKRKTRSILTKSKKRSRSFNRKTTKKIRNVLLRGGECSEIRDMITFEDFASMDPFNKLEIPSGRDGIEYCYDFDALATEFVNYGRSMGRNRLVNWYTQTPFTFVQLDEMRKFVDMKMNFFSTDEQYQKLRLYEDFDKILKVLQDSTVEGQALAARQAAEEAAEAARQVAEEVERPRQAELELLVKQYSREIRSLLIELGLFAFELPTNMLALSILIYPIAFAMSKVPPSFGENPLFEKMRETFRDIPRVRDYPLPPL